MVFNQKMIAIAGAATVAVFGYSAQASAAFLPDFTGYSEFGLDAAGQTDLTCPLCDSTVNFAVFQNESGNWVDDLAQFGAGNISYFIDQDFDRSAEYVYLYQVANNNPLGGPNQPLEDFGITFHPASIMDAGYFSGIAFVDDGGTIDGTNNVTLDDPDHVPGSKLDTPHDGVPSDLSPAPTFDFENVVDPAGFDDNALIANPGIKPGNIITREGVFFQWALPDDLIEAGEASSVLFLTSNVAPDYTWAETVSDGGFGAAGDVPAPAVPFEAESSAGLALLGLWAGYKWRKRRQQAAN